MKVKGWPAVDNGTRIQRGAVEDLKLDKPENLTADPEATTNLRIQGNINIQDGITTTGIPIQLKFYDSLGNLYSANLNMTYDSTANVGSEWNLDIPDTLRLTDTNGNVYTLEAEEDSITIVFDSDGNLDIENSGGTNGTFTISNGGNPFDLTADLNAGDPLIKSTIGPLTVDFTGLTQYNQKPILTL